MKKQLKTHLDNLKLLSVETTIEMQIVAGGVRTQHPFVALVTYAGKSSDHPVGGTEMIDGGPYRVFIPADLMRRKIKELEGCPVFAEAELDSHNKTKSVGEFTSAWVEPMDTPDGRIVLASRASGLLSRDVNPELVDKIIASARDQKLGFSYDMKNIHFTLEAHEVFPEIKVVKVIDFAWDGATILRRDVAAYQFTELAAREKETHADSQKEVKQKMDEKEKQAMLDSIATAVANGVEPLSAKMKEIEDKVNGLAASKTAKDPVEKVEAGESGSQKIGTIDELVEGITAGLKTVIDPLTEKIDTFITASKEKAEPVKEDKVEEKIDETKAEKADDDKKVKEPEKVDSESGFRTSLDAASLILLAKYTDESFEDNSEEITPDQLNAACKKIGADKSLSKQDKDKMISLLSQKRRDMLRQEFRQGLAR